MRFFISLADPISQSHRSLLRDKSRVGPRLAPQSGSQLIDWLGVQRPESGSPMHVRGLAERRSQTANVVWLERGATVARVRSLPKRSGSISGANMSW